MKPNVTITFDKGDYQEALQEVERLQQHTNRQVLLSPDIHWATFRAFAKEMAKQTETGDVVMPDYYSVHSVNKTTIKRKK